MKFVCGNLRNSTKNTQTTSEKSIELRNSSTRTEIINVKNTQCWCFFSPLLLPYFFFWYEYNAYGIYYYFSLVFFTSPDVTCYRSTKNDWHYIIIWNRSKALFESSTNEIRLLYIGISSFLLLITAQIQSKWKFWHFKSHCNMNEAITYTSPLQHRRSYGVCWCDVYFNICR